MRNSDVVLETLAELGDKAFGLMVQHRGRTIHLSGCPGDWTASTFVDPPDTEERYVPGYGATIAEALDAAADEAELYENPDADDSDVEESDDE